MISSDASRRGFTLVELLVVVGIMGLLGAATVGGYRQMRRGMEEKGALQNADTLIRAAYQRAQIDRQPAAVFFWNETIRAADADENEIVVGHAVAVRRAGRVTRVMGQVLVDEFADLEQTYPVREKGDPATSTTMYLYAMDNLDDVASAKDIKRSEVETSVEEVEDQPLFLQGVKSVKIATSKGASSSASSPQRQGKIVTYGFKVKNAGGIQWKQGMAYGFEFAHLVLPRNFIFGSSYSTSAASPIEKAGSLVFDTGKNSGTGMGTDGTVGRSSVTVYALLPNASGELAPKRVGSTSDPSESLR